MKLEAAKRLVTAIAEGQSMDLQYVINTLADQGIKATSPDAVPNSVVANEHLNPVMVAFAVQRWKTVEKYDVEGGLYCSGVSVILERGDQKIKLMHTAHKRVVIWLP
jgi:hypothetical protein